MRSIRPELALDTDPIAGPDAGVALGAAGSAIAFRLVPVGEIAGLIRWWAWTLSVSGGKTRLAARSATDALGSDLGAHADVAIVPELSSGRDTAAERRKLLRQSLAAAGIAARGALSGGFQIARLADDGRAYAPIIAGHALDVALSAMSAHDRLRLIARCGWRRPPADAPGVA